MDALAELQRLIVRHAGGELRRPGLDGVAIMATSEPTMPLPSIAQPTLALTVQGAKRTIVNETAFDYGAGEYLVISVELPVTSHITRASGAEPYVAFGLDLRPATIAALLLEAAAHDGRASARPAGIGISTASPELIDATVRLLRLLDHPRDAAALAPAFEREILWRLICGGQGAMVRQIGLADSRLAHVSRAIGWIRQHYDETIRVEELARMAAMSVSAFHRQFRAVTQLSPIQYQKQVRLQEARAQLVTQPGNVAAIGFAVGYDSASQFSRDYRRLFGAPPGRDAQQLRKGAAALSAARA
ncbi:MAG TPA: AraC family transcriptional regulator [Conexibacter sp.]|jgi:AraC-like DNA-binding protein